MNGISRRALPALAGAFLVANMAWGQTDSEPEAALMRAKTPLRLPEHPRLLLNAEGVQAMKSRIDAHDWARDYWASLRAGLDAILDETVVLPPRGGNWWHWYVCPEHSAPLEPGKKIAAWQWEHVCPIDAKIFTGDATRPSRDYDGCLLFREHHKRAKQVLSLGLAYQLCGEAQYAAKAREILLAYAEAYPGYPLHNTRSEPTIGGAKVQPQTLDEAVWLIDLCQGMDLVWDALAASDREQVIERVIRPSAVDVILPHKMGVHNIQCWKNSAVGLAGFLIGDAALVEEAINNPHRGYWKQMAKGVRPDGAWWEGAWGYHFYTMRALWPLVEGARLNGIDLYSDAFKAMYDAPLKLKMPDFRLPAFNDSGAMNLVGAASAYEIAQARFPSPEYADLLAQSNRQNQHALCFGVPKAAKAAEKTWESVNYEDSGYAILAQGNGRAATWLCLKYGPHGGGHGHPDKLNFALYHNGTVVAADPGTARYGSPYQGGWYKTTVAHNTLVVDESSQHPAEGKLLGFGPDYVTAEAGPTYKGIRHVRSAVLVSPALLFFIDRIEADQEHTFDLVYHQAGTWDTLPDGQAWDPPDKAGYRHLRDATRRTADSEIHLATSLNNGRKANITLAGGEPTEIITATGIGNHVEDRVPVVLFRRIAKATTYAWAISLDGSPVTIESGEEDNSWLLSHEGQETAIQLQEEGQVVSTTQ